MSQHDARPAGNTRLAPGAAAVVFVLACVWAARAQELPPSAYYDGQTVIAVHVIANPELNAESLLALSQQKAKEPYSTAKMKASVASFMATGKFTHVDVTVKPEAEGLDITFILQPAYYIGMITFPGALRAFDYGRLIQAVDYPAGQPFSEERALARAAAIKRLFTREGYFEARVVTKTSLDPTYLLGNIAYHVTPGPRARIGRIVIKGPSPSEVERIKGALRSFRVRLRGHDLKTGMVFHPGRIEAAAGVIRDYLGKHGWLSNSVTVEKPVYTPENNRAQITFDVVTGPKVSVSVAGAKVSEKTLKKLVPVFEENSLGPDLIDEGQRNLVSYFQTKGYFDVKIHPDIETHTGTISLVYRVERGPRHKVIGVQIAGNHHLETDDLMSLVTVRKGRFFSRGKYSNELVSESVNNLEDAYHDAGFEQVKVTPEISDVNSRIRVTFNIAEGSRTIVHALNIEGMKTQSLATLAPEGLEVKAGRPYSPREVTHDRSRIVASYLNLGYLNASLQASVETVAGNPNLVNVTYRIQEGIQARVNRVAVLGEKETREKFIRHNVTVKPGAPLSEGKMLESESALYNLGIFDWAGVDPARPPKAMAPSALSAKSKPPDVSHVEDDVMVRVHEAKRNSISYGFGIQLTPRNGSLSSGIVALPGLPVIGLPESFKVIEKNYVSPLGSIEYTRRNLFGRGQTAGASAIVSRLDQRAALTYADPEFNDSNWSSLLSLSAERATQNPLFTARFGQASLQFERPLNGAHTERLQLRYSFSRTSLTNLLIHGFVPPEDQSIHSSTLSSSFIRDTRDQPLNAHRGSYETASFGVTPSALGSSDSFARFFGQAAVYRQVKPWMVLAQDVRLGLEAPFAGSHIPISDRFFSGGADSLRGFPLNGAGPQTVATLCTKLNDPASCTSEINVPVGGPQLFIVNSEARFPIPVMKNLGGVLFYDGGNVYNHVGFGHFFNQYSNTVGFGLRYETPVGPVRLDIGRNLSPLPGNKAIQVFFTLGQSF